MMMYLTMIKVLKKDIKCLNKIIKYYEKLFIYKVIFNLLVLN